MSVLAVGCHSSRAAISLTTTGDAEARMVREERMAVVSFMVEGMVVEKTLLFVGEGGGRDLCVSTALVPVVSAASEARRWRSGGVCRPRPTSREERIIAVTKQKKKKDKMRTGSKERKQVKQRKTSAREKDVVVVIPSPSQGKQHAARRTYPLIKRRPAEAGKANAPPRGRERCF